MTRNPRLSEPVRDLSAATDPVAAFVSAHERGELVAFRTSGTSGQARSVVRSTHSWVNSFPHVASLTGLGPSSRVWVPGPLSATMNLFAAVHACYAGASLVDDPEQATHAQLTPSALGRALDDGAPLSGVRVVVAGDRLTSTLHDRAAAAGAQVSHYYGAAELSFVAWGSHEDDLQPFPEVEVSVRGGVIWVRSPYVCRGYDARQAGLDRLDQRRPDGPLRMDQDGFATVGDRGTLAGGTLHVVGRGGDAIVTGGATVHVADVEDALRAVARGEIAVVGLPHSELGAVVAAVLTEETDLAALRAVAGSALNTAQRPRTWFHLPRIPHNAAGKVDRVALVALLVSPDEDARRLT